MYTVKENSTDDIQSQTNAAHDQDQFWFLYS
jgi:hypothetical protein